jgi:tRNA (adenine57-N1/adenine58-N1)-methyltransferase
MPLEKGEKIILYIDKKRKYFVEIGSKEEIHTDKGVIRTRDLMEKDYGNHVMTSKGIKVYILRPQHYDLYRGLKRRSQVVYPKDVAFILYLAGIREGYRVAEAGIGSGFLTIALANSIGVDGKVYAYDIRDDMLDIARKNLEKIGLLDRVVFCKKDIREGFNEKDLDAVILDMPDPWNAVKTSWDSLKPSAPLVTFVPTLNQLEKVHLAMVDNGFIDVRSFETIYREYKVELNSTRPEFFSVTHTGYITSGRKVLK